MKSKILITGAAGFIGYHLIKKLLSENIYSICGLDNLNSYYDINLKKNRLSNLEKRNFIFFESNISSYSCLKEIFDSFKPDIVINLAAQAGVRYSKENPIAYIDSNINGFYNILDLSRIYKIEKLIYASSSSVYGNLKSLPFNEEEKNLKPSSLYGSTKLLNEKLAINFSKNFKLNTLGLRFFTVYGPYGRPDMAYYSFTKNILEKKPITVFNEGKMSRDMTYIDDIVSGIVSAISYKFNKNNYDIFNLGNSTPVGLKEMISILEKKLNMRANINYEISDSEVKNTFADIKKAELSLNFKPKTNLDEGLDKFIDWFKEYYLN